MLLPTAIVVPFISKPKVNTQATPNPMANTEQNEAEKVSEEAINVKVYLSQKDKVIDLPLEEYVVGVVASEMPNEFEPEALKAQALGARTYITSLLLNKDESVPQGADVTDTTKHQAFSEKSKLMEQWGSEYQEKIDKISKAVAATQGQVIVYDNELITASYFSTSNGYTENSEDYWGAELPYLKSVSSPWDASSPKMNEQMIFPVKEFEQKLGVNIDSNDSLNDTITKQTASKRVEEITINNVKMSGKDVRERLNLPSTDFDWMKEGNHIVVTTKGYGHGVGMSQYGANGMAKEGKSYKDIIKHYYTGVSIVEDKKFLEKYVAVN